MDLVKVDQDVAHIAYFCKCFQWYVTSVLKKCFICFQTYVAATILSECCICFIHVLQVFYLDVAYVSYTCCKCFIWMFYMFHTYVATVCFKCCICVRHMLHQSVSCYKCFIGAWWVMGAWPGRPGMGRHRVGVVKGSRCPRGGELGFSKINCKN
jgi:hypothetical protein